MAPKPRDGFPDFHGKTVCNGRIRLVEELGEGAYGVVYRGVDASSKSGEPRQYAVKILEKADPRSHRWIFQQREVTAHQSVSDHPNIVKLYEVHQCQHFVYIVLEYCPGRDLFYALVDRHLYCYNDELVKSVILQILDALEYCHEHDVFHRDLKPDNVLTNEDGTKVKLADFGLCSTSPVSDSFRCGSAGYMSPESFGCDHKLVPFSNAASDIWSVGVILTNLISGRSPWQSAALDDPNYRDYLESPNYLRETLPISQQASDVLKAIFTHEPSARVTLPELRKRVLAVDTFFMTHEEIEASNQWIKIAAADYSPDSELALRYRCQAQSITFDSEAREALLGTWEPLTMTSPVVPSASSQPHGPRSSMAIHGPTFVIGSSYDSSSSFEYDSPVLTTPEMYAQDPPAVAGVPGFCESENIGDALASVDRKKLRCRSSPLQTIATI
ncbi:Pkinase-domain-containing protein [Fomes fomentarius]|nr:Pkinase-domain-containing protein [Fomes fomentarius]